jgi:hypothetical protein
MFRHAEPASLLTDKIGIFCRPDLPRSLDRVLHTSLPGRMLIEAAPA